MFLEWSFIHKVSQRASLERPVRVWKSGNPRFRHHLLILLLFTRPTARLVGPEAMIHSLNCFALPCAGPFHKINAVYEATKTTVNSSCLMYGYHCHAIYKLTRDQGAARVYYAYLRSLALLVLLASKPGLLPQFRT